MPQVKLERFLEPPIVLGQSYFSLMSLFSENTQYTSITLTCTLILYTGLLSISATQAKPSASEYVEDTLTPTQSLILEILAHYYLHKTGK